MRGSGREKACPISNTMINKRGILVTLCSGKFELMSKRSSVRNCLGKVKLEQVSSTRSRTEDHHLIKLSRGKGELELSLNKRGVTLILRKRNCTNTYIFMVVMGRNNIFGTLAHVKPFLMKLCTIQKHYLIF